jgi:hypothetical protein
MRTRREILGAVGGAAALSLAEGRMGRVFAQSSRAPKHLILVHGRRQKIHDPAALKAMWVEALQSGAQKAGVKWPADVKVSLPYYGDTLDSLSRRRYGNPEAVDEDAPDPESEPYVREITDEYRHKFPAQPDEVDIDEIVKHKTPGVLNTKPAAMLLRMLDKHLPQMSRETIKGIVRDVWAYLTRPGIQDEIDRVVAREFTEQPAVVVGHSLGSVVAYQVLRTDPRALKVPLFVTIGSPLGIRAIREMFVPLRFPAPIETWYNARDPADFVALNPLDQKNFPVRKENSVFASTIENYDGIRHEGGDRHDIAGYLGNPEVVVRIVNALSA